jgi:hypothetical protein
MSNIRQVQWNEGAPAKLEPGMLIEWPSGAVAIVGHIDDWLSHDSGRPDLRAERIAEIKRWAWLIQPHELNWLEDMASRKTRTQE